MISKEEILRLHHLSIARYGGADGIRDEGLLESAIARPCQTFGGEGLYPTTYEKAGAIMENIIIISISTGEIKFDDIVNWLKQNSIPFKNT